ncbi:MAG: ComF family protein [Aerococcus sp.]|nr:ComF family protein [Aerococcus sp.]
MECLLCGEPFQRLVSLSTVFRLTDEITLPICPSCIANLTPIQGDTCPNCGREQQGTKRCMDCIYWQKQGLELQNKAFYHYDSGFRAWLLLLKGQREQRLARLFAYKLKNYAKQWPDYTWVPIPSSMDNYRQRGFHQTSCILYWSQLPYLELFLPPKTTAKQALQNRKERLENTRQFELIPDAKLPKKVLLFDDVYTTGSTLHQVLQVLEDHGIETVRSMTLAR